MLFDSLILAAVADELGKTVLGGKVERVTQPSPLELVLRIYHAGQTHSLLLSCDPQMARVHLTQIRRESPPQPPAFCSLLRKYLEGAWVHAVSLPLGFGERVLHLEFRATDGAPYTLIAETMGRLSNVILVNGAGIILGAVKHIGHDLNRFRQVLPGLPYRMPPKQRTEEKEPKRDPLQFYEPPGAGAMTPDAAREWLIGTFTGVSPLLAQEVVLRAPVGALSLQTLWYALSALLSVARVGDWSPRVWSDDRGETQGAYPIALRSVSDKNQYPRDSISLALDSAAGSLGRRDTFERARDALLTALRRSRKQREREQQELSQGMRNAERADEYQQTGDLLLARQGTLPRGESHVEVQDYYAPPQSDGTPARRAVALDPTLSIHENAERFFRRSQKARKSVQALRERTEIGAAEIPLLEIAEQQAAQAQDREQIARVRESVAALLFRNERQNGSGEPGEDAHKSAAPEFDGHKIRRFRAIDGWEILVGENATANDYLTTKLAASSDIWLHVRAAASAHGIIRAQNRPGAVSPAAIQHAAELVAARSEVKHSSLVPVDYTLKKYVRKPRKSAPGAVTYQNEKTLYVSGIHG